MTTPNPPEEAKACTHFHGGVGRMLHNGECVVCIAIERDAAQRATEEARGRADAWVKAVTDAVVGIAFDSGACVPKDSAVDYYAGNSSKAMRDLEWYARKAIELRKERDTALADLAQARSLLERVRERLDKRLWSDKGHHCESRSVVMAVAQMVDAFLTTPPTAQNGGAV